MLRFILLYQIIAICICFSINRVDVDAQHWKYGVWIYFKEWMPINHFRLLGPSTVHDRQGIFTLTHLYHRYNIMTGENDAYIRITDDNKVIWKFKKK
jgi:hypothetical protein